MCCPWEDICSFGDSIVIHFGLDSMGFQKLTVGFIQQEKSILLQGLKPSGLALQDADVFFKPTIKKGLFLQIINCKSFAELV